MESSKNLHRQFIRRIKVIDRERNVQTYTK